MNPVIYRLKVVHTRLDAELRREMKSRWSNSDRVTRLKKLKLAIKDRLQGTARHALRIG